MSELYIPRDWSPAEETFLNNLFIQEYEEKLLNVQEKFQQVFYKLDPNYSVENSMNSNIKLEELMKVSNNLCDEGENIFQQIMDDMKKEGFNRDIVEIRDKFSKFQCDKKNMKISEETEQKSDSENDIKISKISESEIDPKNDDKMSKNTEDKVEEKEEPLLSAELEEHFKKGEKLLEKMKQIKESRRAEDELIQDVLDQMDQFMKDMQDLND